MDLQQAYANIPPITKTLVTGAVLVTLAANFGMLPPMSLILDFPSIWYNFEVRSKHQHKERERERERERWEMGDEREKNACFGTPNGGKGTGGIRTGIVHSAQSH